MRSNLVFSQPLYSAIWSTHGQLPAPDDVSPSLVLSPLCIQIWSGNETIGPPCTAGESCFQLWRPCTLQVMFSGARWLCIVQSHLVGIIKSFKCQSRRWCHLLDVYNLLVAVNLIVHLSMSLYSLFTVTKRRY